MNDLKVTELLQSFLRAGLRSGLSLTFVWGPIHRLLVLKRALNKGNLVHSAHIQCLLCAPSTNNRSGCPGLLPSLPYKAHPQHYPCCQCFLWIISCLDHYDSLPVASLPPSLVPFLPLTGIPACVFCFPRLLKTSFFSKCRYLLNPLPLNFSFTPNLCSPKLGRQAPEL